MKALKVGLAIGGVLGVLVYGGVPVAFLVKLELEKRAKARAAVARRA